MQLLHNNSWRRFQESELFAAYLEREALPTTIQCHTPTLVNDTLTQRTPKGRQMLAVHPALTATTTDSRVATSRAGLRLDVDLIQSNRSEHGDGRLLSADNLGSQQCTGRATSRLAQMHNLALNINNSRAGVRKPHP